MALMSLLVEKGKGGRWVIFRPYRCRFNLR
jgi:hypothetical protein